MFLHYLNYLTGFPFFPALIANSFSCLRLRLIWGNISVSRKRLISTVRNSFFFFRALLFSWVKRVLTRSQQRIWKTSATLHRDKGLSSAQTFPAEDFFQNTFFKMVLNLLSYLVNMYEATQHSVSSDCLLFSGRTISFSFFFLRISWKGVTDRCYLCFSSLVFRFVFQIFPCRGNKKRFWFLFTWMLLENTSQELQFFKKKKKKSPNNFSILHHFPKWIIEVFSPYYVTDVLKLKFWTVLFYKRRKLPDSRPFLFDCQNNNLKSNEQNSMKFFKQQG